jgi:xylulokinase
MIASLDLGTSNVKALLTDLAGAPQAEASRSIQLHPVGDGGLEQDLEEIWQATQDVLRQIAARSRGEPIRTLGVSSQGGALQLFHSDGRPSGRVISWLDQRGQAQDTSLTEDLGRDWFRQRIGHGASGLAIGQLLRLGTEFPASLRPPRYIGFVGDAIVARLCGRAAHDSTSCGLTLLHNPALRSYEPELLARLGIEASQLPALLPAREPAGTLLPEPARQTGLPIGIPVSVAIHDQYAAALGTGAVEIGTVMIGAGTAWVLLAVMDHLAPPVIDEAFVCAHVVDGLFGQILSLVNGGSALSWMLQLTGARATTVPEVDCLLAAAPAGCDGLMFWPFMSRHVPPGLSAGARGRLTGLQLHHGAAHAIRAVVEGLACELNRHLLFLRDAGCSLRFLVLGGAVAGSRVTPQLLADVTGLPVACAGAGVGAGSLRGAAILARSLIEPERPLTELVREMTPPCRVVLPGRDAARYRDLFAAYRDALLPLRS